MRIGITAPVFIKNQEHKRYLDLTTRSMVSRDHDIVFLPVENFVEPALLPLMYVFNHQPESMEILKPTGEQSVSKAWNMGITWGKDLGCDYILVINTDIVFKSNAIDRLVAFAEQFNKQEDLIDVENTKATADVVMWTMAEYADLGLLEESAEDENYSEHPHFSCFMVKSNFFDHVGMFDENFKPAYCEDGDMHARLALANKKAYVYGGARFYHFGSRTIKSDQAEWQKNQETFPKNQEYFLSKWGHPIVNDVERMREVYFKHPYNEEDKDLSYWKS